MSRVIGVLLAVVAAIGWGGSDFYGGDASHEDRSVFGFVAVAELLGLLVMTPLLFTHGAPPIDNPRFLFAALAGVAVTCELGLTYRALNRGNSFITAPTGALGTAIAVGAGLIGGDPLNVAVGIGLPFALVGGGVSAWSSPASAGLRGSRLKLAATCLIAAAAVGIMLTTLHAAGQVDPYWATAIEHISTALTAGALALVETRGSVPGLLPRYSDIPKLGVVALGGTFGDLAYTVASRGGTLSTVAAISSLYPVATITLGCFIHSQRPNRVQLAGMVLALSGAAILGATTR